MNTRIRLKYIIPLLVLAILILLPAKANAADTIDSGTCGENLIWTLDADGILTVSGSGGMDDFSASSAAPWDDYYEDITAVMIGEGVTSVGKQAFYDYPNLGAVTFSDTVSFIGNASFRDCVSIKAITIPASVTEISTRAFGGCTGLTEITFLGDAPNISRNAFSEVTAAASYPSGNNTWTTDMLDGYGGTLEWHSGCIEHSFGSYTSNADATCTADGTKTAVCTVCGAEDTLPDEGSRLPHSVPAYESNGDATCTADGTKTGTCDVCGANETVIDEGSKRPHTYTNYISDNNATCTDGTETALCDFGCGAKHTRTEEGSADAALHQYAEIQLRKPSCTITGYYVDVCKNCGNAESGRTEPATGHSIGIYHSSPATCTAQGYTGDRICRICGYIEAYGQTIDYAEHAWDENQANWVTVLCATYTHNGIAVTSCTRPGCSATVNRELPKLESSNPFTDVQKGSYAYDAIMWAVREGITTGRTETRFMPKEECLRAEVVTFLHRTISDVENADEMPFKDVKPNNYFYNAVNWAAKNGITSGVSPTQFAPYRSCTRAQVVTFLWRASGCPVVSGSNRFEDVSAGAYYHDAVLWAAQSGITTGTDQTHFSPDLTCTREQIVTFLYRCFASSGADAAPAGSN